jgi:iron complex outermembrane receptor protein
MGVHKNFKIAPMTRSFLVTIVLGWTGAAWAQTTEPLSEKDFFTEMPIVLSVSRLPQRLDETPGAVTILDRDMIRLSGARDVADLLRLVPGFQTSTSFESGAPLASYHGALDAYSIRMQVLVDGRSTYSPYLIGSVAPGMQAVALQDIERIEVLRGSNSASYGARAVLGVVNIVTRSPLDTLGVRASVTSGENDVNDTSASLGWQTDLSTMRLSVDRRSDAGLSGANGRNRLDRVNFRSDWRASRSDEVQLRAGLVQIDAGKGTPGSREVRNATLNTTYAQLDWRHTMSEDSDLALQLSHTKEAYVDRFTLIPLNFDGTSANTNLALTHTFRQGPDLRVAWGGELRREAVSSLSFYSSNDVFNTDFARVFANAEWHLSPNWVLNAGGLAEHNTIAGNNFSPRVMVNWHVQPGQTLRAGISRAFRPPSTFEQSADLYYGALSYVRGRGTVEPEKFLIRELGYLGDFPNVRLNLDVRVFEERISGFIRQQNQVFPRYYANDEDFPIRGAEYQLKWQAWKGANLIFGQSFINIGSQQTATPFAAPKLATTVTLFQKLPGGVDLSLMHQDNGIATQHGAGYDERVAMTRTDVRLGWPMRLGASKAEMALVVQSLGGRYQDYAKDNYFERRAFISFKVEL